MNSWKSILPFVIIVVSLSAAAAEQADRTRQPGVPQGKITTGEFAESHLFPGTKREYSVYVPAQYKPRISRRPDGLHGWRRATRKPTALSRAGRVRQSDSSEGDAGHDRRVRESRARFRPRSPAPRTAAIGRSNTTRWAIATPISWSTSSCRSRSRGSMSRRIPRSGRSAASRRAASVPSPSRGRSRISSARCSATSAASPTFAAAGRIRDSFARRRTSRRRSRSTCRTARTTSTTCTATGRWAIRTSRRRCSSPATSTSS